MSISAMLSSGMQGMLSSINRTTVASSGLNVENDDFAGKMIAMHQGEIDAKLAADVIKTADQILGTIIDIHG